MESKMNPQHQEGAVAKAIEEQTAKAPSDIFLWAAAATWGTAVAFKMCKDDHRALFIGQWVAPILILGLYNKLVKLEGHDSMS